jgi:hypothetical protein
VETARPSNLNNDVLVDDNAPSLLPAKKNSQVLQPPPANANIPRTQVEPPTADPSIEVNYRDDGDFSDEEVAARAERDIALSSPRRQEPNSDVVVYRSSLHGILTTLISRMT